MPTRRTLSALALIPLLVPLTTAWAAPVYQTAKPKVSAPFLLAGGSGNQWQPSVAGGFMAYTDCRQDVCNVWGMDLATRQTSAIDEQGWDQQQPATDGVRVVWRDGRNTSSRDEDNRLNNFDIAGTLLLDHKPFAVSHDVLMQNRPSVWGNVAVWADFRDTADENDTQAGDIYMADVPSGRQTAISKAKSAQTRPVTNGKVVVWTDYRNEPDPNGGNSDIYGYDIASGQEFAISTAPGTQTDPAISGNIVVWSDYRNGATSDIWAFDLTTHKEFAVTTAPGSQVQPAISGNIVVWADYRNERDPAGQDSDIYGYDLSTKQEFPIYRGSGPQHSPKVGGNTVVWEDWSKGNQDIDIMGANISGIAITPPDAPPPAVPGSGSKVFAETGREVSGLFYDYWQKNGGLQQQGLPLSDPMQETSELDGKQYTVQYFERAVFEYRPEQKPPYNVLLSQLGTFRYKQKYPNGAPNQTPNNAPGSVFFAQTGHTVGGLFLQYWQQHGGLAQQGYPISEEFTEVSDLNGQQYTVQYFERAEFEYHPENPAPYDVLLSQLGRFKFEKK